MVNAAGPNAGHLARKLGIHLPVEPRKRFIFVLDCPEAPKIKDMPSVIDCSGLPVRPEGGGFTCGVSPAKVSTVTVVLKELRHGNFADFWSKLS